MRMRMWRGASGIRGLNVTGLLFTLLLTLLACTVGHAPDSAPPPLVTPTLIRVPEVSDDAARVELYTQQILAQQEQQAINATLAAVYAQQTATVEAFAATATARAWDATATAEAQRATATARAWQTTVEAAYAQGTATAQAHHVQATATAQVAATATAQADHAARATATVEAVYFQATATAIADQQAVEEALRKERIRREQLVTRQEEIVYPVKAYGPWVILLALVGLILWGGHGILKAYMLRLRAIQRDERGDAPVLILNQGRQIVAYDPDRAFGPALLMGRDGQVTQPQLAPPELQGPVTLRDQTIDAVTRGRPGNAPSAQQKRAAQAMVAQPPPTRPTPAGPVRIVEARQVRGWLKDVTPQALRGMLTLDEE